MVQTAKYIVDEFLAVPPRDSIVKLTGYYPNFAASNVNSLQSAVSSGVKHFG